MSNIWLFKLKASKRRSGPQNLNRVCIRVRNSSSSSGPSSGSRNPAISYECEDIAPISPGFIPPLRRSLPVDSPQYQVENAVALIPRFVVYLIFYGFL